MECLVGKQEKFKVDSLINRAPVTIVTQNRDYVVMFSGERDKAYISMYFCKITHQMLYISHHETQDDAHRVTKNKQTNNKKKKTKKQKTKNKKQTNKHPPLLTVMSSHFLFKIWECVGIRRAFLSCDR